MENLNVKFKQYGLILLQDFNRTKALNDAEPDAGLHIAFPPAHNVVQDLEGLEADLRTDDRQENFKSDHSQRKIMETTIRKSKVIKNPTNQIKYLPCQRRISSV